MVPVAAVCIVTGMRVAPGRSAVRRVASRLRGAPGVLGGRLMLFVLAIWGLQAGSPPRRRYHTS
ncbi:MAG: hypothetical protein ACRDJG_00610 [Actinomycetota bacterium]